MKTRNWKNRKTQDAKYYEEYKNKIYHNAEMKGDMNLFITLKGLRKGCNVYLRSRWFQKRFEEILDIYQMNYVSFENDLDIEYFISKRKFDKKKLIEEHEKPPSEHKYIGKFLGYPAFSDVSNGDEERCGVQFWQYDTPNQRQLIYGYRVPKDFPMTKWIGKWNQQKKKMEDVISESFGKKRVQLTLSFL